MATKLDKDVVRETTATFRDKGKDKNIVVKLHKCNLNQGACITLSLKGNRGDDMDVVVSVWGLYNNQIYKKHGFPSDLKT